MPLFGLSVAPYFQNSKHVRITMYLKVHNYSGWKRINVQFASEMSVFKPSEPKIVIRKSLRMKSPAYRIVVVL